MALEEIVTRWIERTVGSITHIERQGRWRPAWYVDAIADGKPVRLYVRGDRGGDVRTQPQPLSFEYKVLDLFAQSGLRVPRLYGFIDEIPAIVMERVPGTPDLKSAANDAARDAVTSQFVDQMVLMHGVDAKRMEAAGAPRPRGAEALALAFYRRLEPLYTGTKNRPEPTIEFVRRWLARNVPPHPDVAYPIAVDAGQFIFEGDRLTAMLDFEFATLGDYHVDLAALRLRNRMERIGDLQQLYRLYAERSGRVVDPQRIRYHTVIKGVLPPMHMAGNLGAPTTAIDYLQWAIWYTVWLRIALESIAEMKGWEAEVFVPPSAATAARHAIVFDATEMDVEAAPTENAVARFQQLKTRRALRYLRRAEIHQPVLERMYLEDVRSLTGSTPANWSEADAQLERHVLSAPPAEDERLLRVLWRFLLGQCFLLADPLEPVNFELLMTPLEPIDL